MVGFLTRRLKCFLSVNHCREMSGLQLNYEETLPPLQSLLAGGVPSLATLETYIANLDVDLEENSKE